MNKFLHHLTLPTISIKVFLPMMMKGKLSKKCALPKLCTLARLEGFANLSYRSWGLSYVDISCIPNGRWLFEWRSLCCAVDHKRCSLWWRLVFVRHYGTASAAMSQGAEEDDNVTECGRMGVALADGDR